MTIWNSLIKGRLLFPKSSILNVIKIRQPTQFICKTLKSVSQRKGSVWTSHLFNKSTKCHTILLEWLCYSEKSIILIQTWMNKRQRLKFKLPLHFYYPNENFTFKAQVLGRKREIQNIVSNFLLGKNSWSYQQPLFPKVHTSQKIGFVKLKMFQINSSLPLGFAALDFWDLCS